MGFKIEWIGGFNPFEFITCPLCGGQDFVSNSLTSTWCAKCNTQFKVRHTAGDPGCVVDAFTAESYGDTFECPKCGIKKASMSSQVACPHCKSEMEHRLGFMGALSQEERIDYYQVLKLGDYVSGWMVSNGKSLKERYEHPSCKDPELQKRWDEHQQKKGFRLDRSRMMGGPRFQLLSAPAEPSTDIPGICKYLDCYTGHIAEDDMKLLDLEGRPRLKDDIVSIPHEYGAWVHAVESAVEEDYATVKAGGFSDAFINVLTYARASECDWINLDSAGTVHASLAHELW